MVDLDKKQKLIFVGIGALILIICIYIYYRTKDLATIEKFDISNSEINVIEEEESKTKVGDTEMENIIAVEDNVKKVEMPKIFIHIMGEVANEGVVEIGEGSRIIDVINNAGGLTEKADLTEVNLVYPLADGQKIYIPSVDEKEEKIPVITTPMYQNSSESIIDKSKIKVNLNTATQTELEQLKGIGPSLAAAIIQYRVENGRFNQIDEIQEVSGIGAEKYKKIVNNLEV